MSQYLILIYDDETVNGKADGARNEEMMAGHQRFLEKNAEAIAGGNALRSTATATTVRPDRSGGVSVTDGPFVETKEALGGYYLVEADDLDAVIDMAKQIPTISGGVEIRPIMVFN